MKLPDLNLITEVLFRGEEIAQSKGLENNTPICVLIALLEEEDSYAVKVLQRFGCDVEKLHDNLLNSIKQENHKFETRFLRFHNGRTSILFSGKRVCALCEAPPKLRSGFCVAVAPYKGLTPLAPLARLSPFPTGGFRELSAILPLRVKLNIVFHTRPFAGFPGKRSFFISRLKL